MYKIIISITALLISIVILQFANSTIAPTVVLIASRSGCATGVVGLIPAIYGLGFVIGCFWARKLMKSIGHIRSFSLAAAILTSLTLLMYISDNTLGWMIYRGLMGCAIAIIMTCIDSWVGSVTPAEMRGRVMGFYSMITKLAYVGAPALLSVSVTISSNALLFALLLFSLSLIPVCLTKLPQPSLGPKITTSFETLFRDVPSAFVAVFILGLTNTAVLNLLPVYGISVGLSQSDALFLLAMAHVGGLAMQWPIGYISDIIGRRQTLVIAFTVSTIAAFAMVFSNSFNIAFASVLSALWGGFALSAYSIALSHAIDRSKSEETVNVCATMLTTWSIGSIFGPFAGGLIMQIFGAASLYIFCLIFHFVTAMVIFLRILTSKKRNEARELADPAATEALWPKNRPLS